MVVEGFNIIMQKMVELGKFKAFKFKGSNNQVSLLQFTDDTLIIGERSWENVRTIKSVLKLFELISSLKVLWWEWMLNQIGYRWQWITWIARWAKRLSNIWGFQSGQTLDYYLLGNLWLMQCSKGYPIGLIKTYLFAGGLFL